MTVWTVHLGRRHGLLQAFAKARSPLTALQAARRARRDLAPVKIWCEAAAALGLLDPEGPRYRLPRELVPLLVDEGSPRFLGGHFDYLALRSLDFDGFDALFRDGRPSARPQRHLIEAYERATPWDHTAFLEIFLPRAPALRRRLERGCDVLDVGAGSGAWDFRVALSYPRSRFVGLEPHATPLRLARASSARRGLEERVRFEEGAGESMTYRERFDFVYLGEVLCGAAKDALVLRRCRRALRAGGHLVIAEGLIDEDAPRGDSGNALVLAMQLEFALQPARFFTKRALAQELRHAGFSSTRYVAAGGGFFFTDARA